MKNLPILFLVVSVLAIAACSSVPGVGISGNATGNTVIDGIEVWRPGPPPRPYRVIALTGREGPDNSVSYYDEEVSIAREARQRGADAVIIVNAVMAVSRMDMVGGHPILAPKVSAELIKYE